MRVAAVLLVASLLAAASARADVLVTLQWQGIERDYYVHVPRGAGSGPLPLVIALHGAGDDARGFANQSRLADAADKLGMLVVFPDGSEGGNPPQRTFNAQICCGDAVTRHVDDIGFIGAVIDDVAQRRPVDRSRVYATGISNGGMLTYQLAAIHPEWFAAVAPVSAAIGGLTRDDTSYLIPMPKTPVPVMIINGRKDLLILYEGGSSPLLPFPHRWKMSVDDAVSFWASSDGCDPKPKIADTDGTTLKREVYGNCDGNSEVVLWQIVNGDHNWPGDIFPSANGGRAISAAEEILTFFATHRRP
jgi:polyhydroxybutyrate depolymerase